MQLALASLSPLFPCNTQKITPVLQARGYRIVTDFRQHCLVKRGKCVGGFVISDNSVCWEDGSGGICK